MSLILKGLLYPVLESIISLSPSQVDSQPYFNYDIYSKKEKINNKEVFTVDSETVIINYIFDRPDLSYYDYFDSLESFYWNYERHSKDYKSVKHYIHLLINQ